MASVTIANTGPGKTRDKPVSKDLINAVSSAVDKAYGPGYTIVLESGAQGGDKRTGSHRHDAARGGVAGDFRIVAPDGHALAGAELDPLAQSWIGIEGSMGINQKAGSAGGNFTHLDLVGGIKPYSIPAGPGEGSHWYYDRGASKYRFDEEGRTEKAIAQMGYPSVEAYQAAKGLDPDGVIGPITTAAILGDIAGAPTTAVAANDPAQGGVNPATVSPTTAKLAGVMLAEARGEGPDGMAGVGNVVINRAESGSNRFPTSVSEVINDEFAKPLGPEDVSPEEWNQAVTLALGLQGGQIPDNTGGAVYFANVETATASGYGAIKASGPTTVTLGNHTFHTDSKIGPVERASPLNVSNIMEAREASEITPASIAAEPPPSISGGAGGDLIAGNADAIPQLPGINGGAGGDLIAGNAGAIPQNPMLRPIPVSGGAGGDLIAGNATALPRRTMATPPWNPRRDPAGFPIDVNRPLIPDDGGFKTERTMTFNASEVGGPDQIVTVPTVVAGQQRTEQEAMDLFAKGLNPPVQSGFGSFEEADAAAEARSGSIAAARATRDPPIGSAPIGLMDYTSRKPPSMASSFPARPGVVGALPAARGSQVAPMIRTRPDAPVGALPAARMGTMIAGRPETPAPTGLPTTPPNPTPRPSIATAAPIMGPEWGSPAEAGIMSVGAGPLASRGLGDWTAGPDLGLPSPSAAYTTDSPEPEPEPEPWQTNNPVPGTMFADPAMAATAPGEMGHPAGALSQFAASAALPVGSGGTMASAPPTAEVTPEPIMASAPPPAPIQTHHPPTGAQPAATATVTTMASAPPPTGGWMDKIAASILGRNTNGSRGFAANGPSGTAPGGYQYQVGGNRIGQGGQYTTPSGRTITYVQDDHFGQPGYLTGFG